MTTSIYTGTATIPAGTPQAAPVTIDISIPQLRTEVLEWHIPKGAAGLMGFRFTSGGAAVLPKQLGAWIVTENEKGSWAVEGLHDSGKWEITGYNTGAFPHTVYVRFHTAPITKQMPWPGVQFIPLIQLTSAKDLTTVPADAFTSRHKLVLPSIYQAPL